MVASLGLRLVTAALAAVVMGVFVFLLWFGMGFAAQAVNGSKADAIVYVNLVVAPGGGVVAAVAAFVTGLWPYGKGPWLRWLILPASFVLLGIVIFGLMALVFQKGG